MLLSGAMVFSIYQFDNYTYSRDSLDIKDLLLVIEYFLADVDEQGKRKFRKVSASFVNCIHLRKFDLGRASKNSDNSSKVKRVPKN